MKFAEYTLPIHYAPYLVNGDDSGIDPLEVKLIDLWVLNNNLGLCVDVKDDDHFVSYHDMQDVGGATCCTYVFEDMSKD